MEILIKIITLLLLVGLITTPILLLIGLKKLNIKNKFLYYLFFGILITSVLTFTIGWWSDASNQILLNHYGYDYDAMNDIERFKNVSEQNMNRVKTLEITMMGIGWPLKAIMAYIFYSPYLLIVYLINYFIKKKKLTIRQQNISE